MDQMEKKQITNSSTVRRQGSQGPTRGTWNRAGSLACAWELATPTFLTYFCGATAPERKFITFLWTSHHLAGPLSGPHEEFGSSLQDQDEPRVIDGREN